MHRIVLGVRAKGILVHGPLAVYQGDGMNAHTASRECIHNTHCPRVRMGTHGLNETILSEPQLQDVITSSMETDAGNRKLTESKEEVTQAVRGR